MTNPPADLEAEKDPDRNGGWKFLTNHAHVLLAIARNRQITMREAATKVGITERATQTIVADLVEAGYLIRLRQGRRNVYTIPANRPLRHPLDAGHGVDELLGLLVPEGGDQPGKRRPGHEEALSRSPVPSPRFRNNCVDR